MVIGPWPEFNNATVAGVKTHSFSVEMPKFADYQRGGGDARIRG
jgi:hypothetical protein